MNVIVELPWTGCARIYTVYQFREQYAELAARNFAGAEAGEMIGAHLAIDHAELPTLQLAD